MQKYPKILPKLAQKVKQSLGNIKNTVIPSVKVNVI